MVLTTHIQGYVNYPLYEYVDAVTLVSAQLPDIIKYSKVRALVAPVRIETGHISPYVSSFAPIQRVYPTMTLLLAR